MDEKSYKSIIQEYEELLTLVEVVKNDLPNIKQFQKEILSLITNSKEEISKSAEDERKHFEEVLRKAILEIREQEKTALDTIDRTVLEKAATAIDNLKKCEEGLSVSEGKVAELTERFESVLSQVYNATKTLHTALQQLKNAPIQPSSVVHQTIEIDYDERLPVSEIYEKYSALNIPIIIQKTTWTNDYCMYISEFDSNKNTAYGRVYLKGKIHRERSFISGGTICQMYASPNEGAILAIEGGPTEFNKENILYVYRGNIVCYRNRHNITNATGILHDKMGNEIEIDVEHCIDCDKYLISYDSYSEYRKQHGGILLGNIQMTSSGEFNADYDLAEESPLRLSGYTVNAQDNYSINERQFILATIIHEGIMKKHDVSRYLEHFLRVNGQKQNMGLAVRKWKEDLEFAKKYNSSTQPKVYLSGVKRYTK